MDPKNPRITPIYFNPWSDQCALYLRIQRESRPQLVQLQKRACLRFLRFCIPELGTGIA